MTAPLVSIITPTFNRPACLRTLSKLVLNQSVADFEWLVLDDSPQPSSFMQGLSDRRIGYEHIGERQTVGAKRNHLIQKSRADIIAQFDDDDFYGRDYLATMLSKMKESGADFVKLFGFFLYHTGHKLFGYWDLSAKLGPHWRWSPAPPVLVMLDEKNNEIFKDNHLGYGFSFVFRKKVWQQGNYPALDWNEDSAFARAASQQFRLAGFQDDSCICLHILHPKTTSHHQTNTSICYPQFLLPHFLLRRLFPDAEESISR